jgi:hypothetical protein
MPHANWKAYWDKVRKEKASYKFKMIINNPKSWGFRSDGRPRFFNIFKSGPPIPLIPRHIPRRPRPVEDITQEYNIELALIFYETSIT